MEQIMKILSEAPVVYMGTVGEDNKPHIRPFAIGHIKENQLFFCSSKQGGFYQDIIHNPFVEISVMSANYEWIRLSGEMKIVDDVKIKQAILDKGSIAKEIFQTVDHPDFLLFQLIHAKSALLGSHAPKIVEIN